MNKLKNEIIMLNKSKSKYTHTIKMRNINIKKTKTKKSAKQYQMTIHDLPNDIYLNIVNYLPIDDSIQFGMLLDNQQDIRKHLLSREYMKSYLNQTTTQDVCTIILKEMVSLIQKTVVHFQNTVLKPIRLNTTNGTIYTVYPRNLNRSFFVSNIRVPTIPNKSFTISFESLTRNITEMYYGGLDIFVVIVDDHSNKIRNIFLRIPYDCEEYTYGFASTVVRVLGRIITLNASFEGWKVACCYMLYTTNHDDVNVRPVCPNYKTRKNDTFKHDFFETLLSYTLSDFGYEYEIKPWTNEYSVIQKRTALVKYPPHNSYGTEIMLQNIGFTQNSEIMTDVYLNIQNRQYHEVYHPEDHDKFVAFKQQYQQQVQELQHQQQYDENIEIPEN